MFFPNPEPSKQIVTMHGMPVAAVAYILAVRCPVRVSRFPRGGLTAARGECGKHSRQGCPMDVELAEERVLILADRFNMDHAEGRAWTKRTDAFGTMAKITGFLSRPKDDDYEVIYRERRLQPFFRIGCNRRSR